ncbi:Crinkler (CRN) family protein [Phytophthora cinnamomi]|uniref:Crinkler (CRN) family protein n=1 Tax=Phytophthora cinnamomi TaxID=4785 RepID=UPI00355AB2A5|nr:Crinkler (CRN) family protein [Phytophthora cinnamomi]
MRLSQTPSKRSQAKMGYQFPADRMTLHLAKEGGEWLKFADPDVEQLKLGKVSDRIDAIMTERTKMNPTLCIGDFAADFPADEADGDDLHLLVKIQDKAAAATIRGKVWAAEELATVHPRVQSNVWKSVVRISISLSSNVVTTSTALVVFQTSTNLYLLTNLGLWVDERLVGALSSDFKKELAHFLHLHPLSVKDEKCNSRLQPSGADKPRVVIEKLIPDDNEMEIIHGFELGNDVCWKSSADLDFAVFKVIIPEDNRLIACTMASFGVVPTMSVHAYFFRTVPYNSALLMPLFRLKSLG